MQNSTATAIATIQKILINLNIKKKELEKYLAGLAAKIPEMDSITGKYGRCLEDQYEQLCQQLEEELKKHSLELNTYERQALRFIASTALTLDETRQNVLKNHGIEIPRDASPFVVAAYATIIAALRRTLKNPQEVTAVIKKLKVIKQDRESTSELQKDFQGDLKRTLEEVARIQDILKQTIILSPEQETEAQSIADKAERESNQKAKEATAPQKSPEGEVFDS